jgi:hypothetical protein
MIARRTRTNGRLERGVARAFQAADANRDGVITVEK